MDLTNRHIKDLLKRLCVRAASAAFVFALVFSPTFSLAAKDKPARNIIREKPWTFSSIMADLTNQERSEKKLNTLAMNPLLNYAAQMKAEDMARKGYFAHVNPEGKSPWYWFTKAGYKYEYAGENLAVNFSDPKKISEAWMASPPHKANVVDKHYTEVGTGMAWGKLNGQKVVFIAQIYANPARI